MNNAKKLVLSFNASINIFLSPDLPVYIHKVFNFAYYQQVVNGIYKTAYYQQITLFKSVNNKLITLYWALITILARKIVYICQHY